MPATTNQLKNLSRMETVVRGNQQACILTKSLWVFYNYRLYCTIHENKSKQNRIRVLGIAGPNDIRDVGFCISVRRDDRIEEALVHELLHANLVRLGFPKFWIHRNSEPKLPSAGAIINLAEHKVMLPVFTSFGYSEDRFLAQSRELNDRESRVEAYFKSVRHALQNPARYLEHVSACLTEHGVHFESIDVRTALLKRVDPR